jgi:hypothetical protein
MNRNIELVKLKRRVHFRRISYRHEVIETGFKEVVERIVLSQDSEV